MPSPFDRHEGQSSQLPDHASHLILVLVQSWHPPLPPRLDHRDPLHVFHQGQPSQSAHDGNVGVNVSRIDPNPQARLDEFWVKVLARVGKLDILGLNRFGADIPLDWIDMEYGENSRFIEEMVDT